MKCLRPLAFVLLGLLAACAQPSDLEAPTLVPQFGTAGDDLAAEVAANRAHPYIYTAGGTLTEANAYFNNRVFLRRYNRDGSFAWERRSPLGFSLGGVGTDAAGNVYVTYGRLELDSSVIRFSKLDRSGRLLWRKDPQAEGSLSWRRGTGVGPLTVDDAGNSYLSIVSYTYIDASFEPVEVALRKYSSSGELLWERVLVDFGEVEDLSVAPDGSLYAVSRNSLSRYDSAGTLLWTQNFPADPDGTDRVINSLQHVAASSDAVYLGGVYYSPSYLSPTVLKYSTSGKLLWERTFTFNEWYPLLDLSVDASGNVYLTAARDNNAGADYVSDVFVRRYTPSGDLSWTFQPKLPMTDEAAYAVVPRSSTEIYIAGRTSGKVNGRNEGGYDAFLLRLNGQGQRVWSR